MMRTVTPSFAQTAYAYASGRTRIGQRIQPSPPIRPSNIYAAASVGMSQQTRGSLHGSSLVGLHLKPLVLKRTSVLLRSSSTIG